MPDGSLSANRVRRLRRAVAAYNDRDISGLSALFAENAECSALGAASQWKSRREIEAALRRRLDADVTCEIESPASVRDAVVVDLLLRSPSGEREITYWVLRFDGQTVVRADSYADRHDALQAADEQPGLRSVGPPALDVEGISKRYRRNAALVDVSMQVHGGEIVAIIGENGAGKSTLLRICAGLVIPDSGIVVRNVAAGYCPQEPALFDLLTPEEHILLFARGFASRRDGLASRADRVAEAGRELIASAGVPARSLVRNLSGGARQKLNLALSLLGEPGILLLDEPYQGFDHGSYVDFWQQAHAWRTAGKAVVVVTHLLTELHRVDRVIELRKPPIGG